MSNPITDILNECLDLRVDEGQAYIHDTDEALQALYEAVVASKPQYLQWADTAYTDGYQKALDDWLTNLSLLFGQDGGLEKPKGGSK